MCHELFSLFFHFCVRKCVRSGVTHATMPTKELYTICRDQARCRVAPTPTLLRRKYYYSLVHVFLYFTHPIVNNKLCRTYYSKVTEWRTINLFLKANYRIIIIIIIKNHHQILPCISNKPDGICCSISLFWQSFKCIW